MSPITSQAHSTGTASAKRCTAVAVGGSSDSRTKMGAKAMPQAPANSAASARRSAGAAGLGSVAEVSLMARFISVAGPPSNMGERGFVKELR